MVTVWPLNLKDSRKEKVECKCVLGTGAGSIVVYGTSTRSSIHHTFPAPYYGSYWLPDSIEYCNIIEVKAMRNNTVFAIIITQ